MIEGFEIREVRPGEYEALGRLLVEVYAALPGFPRPEDQPEYYDKLRNVGRLNEEPDTSVLVAVAPDGRIAGGVVYFGDMARYGSGGTAPREKNASGIRLLGVDPAFRGRGIGRALTEACIARARGRGHGQVILHTTRAMEAAWRMYEGMGFRRSPDLDFLQKDLPVFGFRLRLTRPG
ncbi:GNAT family N-acetyltransferase [Deferrisoma palaeochoriense]